MERKARAGVHRNLGFPAVDHARGVDAAHPAAKPKRLRDAPQRVVARPGEPPAHQFDRVGRERVAGLRRRSVGEHEPPVLVWPYRSLGTTARHERVQ